MDLGHWICIERLRRGRRDPGGGVATLGRRSSVSAAASDWRSPENTRLGASGLGSGYG
jgi:hypothetical protein